VRQTRPHDLITDQSEISTTTRMIAPPVGYYTVLTDSLWAVNINHRSSVRLALRRCSHGYSYLSGSCTVDGQLNGLMHSAHACVCMSFSARASPVLPIVRPLINDGSLQRPVAKQQQVMRAPIDAK